jgi:diguanylate cyclase (GGDEF)-like protein
MSNRSLTSSALFRATRVLAAVSIGLVSTGSYASCLPSDDLTIRAYERRIGTDPASVARELEQRLGSETGIEGLRRAELFATLAESLSVMDRHEEVRKATQEGLALVTDKRSPVYVNLLSVWAANTFDEASVPGAIARVEANHKLQPESSPAEACMLIALGQLEHQSARTDRASVYLTRAYRMSVGEERRTQRAMAADTLSLVLRDVGDFSQALALNQEVIDWDLKRDATFSLATTRFIRAAILREMGEHQSAIAELEASRALSIGMNDEIGVAYDDLLLCQSNIVLSELKLAQAQCNGALRVFEREQSAEAYKQALTGLAHIDLLENRPRSALERLDRVLDRDGRDMVPRRLSQVYELRAQAHEALGQPTRALADFKAHMERFKAASEADRATDAAAIRARFETDREIERNAFLKLELEAKSERLAAQTARLRWMIFAALTSGVVIALLAYLLLANKRKKRMLARLAQQDDLTQLPNRRRTFELASEALDVARQQGQPITIGILDLDHFKRINDSFGHATGDAVLQAFAQVGRRSIRDADVLGRWGGEEFLLVLPNTPLDVALEVVDRFRTSAGDIRGGQFAADLNVTVSAGLATNEGGPSQLEEIIASADAALYDAKEGGRNMVCVAPESYRLASTGVRRVLKDSGFALSTGSFERRDRGSRDPSKNQQSRTETPRR